MSRLKQKCNGRYGIIIDSIAFVCLIGFTVGFIRIITHSVNVGDESFNVCLAHRFCLGDAPIVDEWSVHQFTGVLLWLPFSVFYFFTKSTDGIILYFRILYAVCQLLITSYIYVSLRVYGNRRYEKTGERCLFAIGALIASVVFACFIPACIPTLSYYSMSLMGLAVFSVTLFCYPPGKLKYFFCGVVSAATALANPAAIVLYMALLLIVGSIGLINLFAKKKIKAQCCDKEFLLFLNLGGYSLAIPVTVLILSRSGISAFIDSFHHLFESTEYDFSLSGGNIIDVNLYRIALNLYGSKPFIALLIITVLAVLLYRIRRYTRIPLLLGLFAVLISAYVHSWTFANSVGTYHFGEFCLYHGLPLYLSGPVFMLLNTKVDKRMCCAWVCCAAFSFLFSLSSDIAIGWGGIAAGIFSVILAVQIIIEEAGGLSLKKKGLTLFLSFSVAASLLTAFTSETQWFIVQTDTFFVEEEISPYYSANGLDIKLKSGPMKGIYTTRKIAEVYETMLYDLNLTRQFSSDPTKSIFVNNLAPWYYLVLDRDYGTYSTWFLEDEYPRLKEYWQEHPEKIPEYVYVPYYSIYLYSGYMQESIDALKNELGELIQFESIKVEAGEILHVTGYLPE